MTGLASLCFLASLLILADEAIEARRRRAQQKRSEQLQKYVAVLEDYYKSQGGAV